MIEVRALLIITADTDEQADAVLHAAQAAGRAWPNTPIVSVLEHSREAKP